MIEVVGLSYTYPWLVMQLKSRTAIILTSLVMRPRSEIYSVLQNLNNHEEKNKEFFAGVMSKEIQKIINYVRKLTEEKKI